MVSTFLLAWSATRTVIIIKNYLDMYLKILLIKMICLWFFTGKQEPSKSTDMVAPLSKWTKVEIGGVHSVKLNISIKAFLDTLAAAEGTITHSSHCKKNNGYSALVGCNVNADRLISDYTSHPRNRKRINKHISSDAAGRYQILSRTWRWAAPKVGADDFSPENQDKVAVWLLEQRGALDHIKKIGPSNYKLFQRALILSNKEWASLPGSPYGQKTHSLRNLWNVYKAAYKTYTLYQLT